MKEECGNMEVAAAATIMIMVVIMRTSVDEHLRASYAAEGHLRIEVVYYLCCDFRQVLLMIVKLEDQDIARNETAVLDSVVTISASAEEVWNY